MSFTVKKTGRFANVMVLTLFFVGVGQTQAQSFDLSILVKKGDSVAGKILTGQFFDSGLTDSGEVILNAEFDGGLCKGSGVTLPGCGAFNVQNDHLNDHLLFKTGTGIDGKTLQIFGFSSFGGVNNNGVVAAGGLFTPPSFPPGSAHVFTHNGIAGVLVAPGSGPPVLNNNNVMFFNGGHAAFTHSGGVTTLIAMVGDVIDGKTLTDVGEVDGINDAGNLAFIGDFSGGRGVITRIGGVLSFAAKTGDVIGGKTLTDVRSPRINNNNEVVFVGTFSGGEGIFSTQRGLLVQTGDTIDGILITQIGAPVLNNAGEVAFHGNFNDVVFTLDDVVVASGDVIDGKTLLSGGIGAVDLNNNGVVIILGSLGDSSGPIGQAIILATPDLDGDGIPNDEDHCPNSDLSPTVVIDGCDSGVENDLLGNGCTIADQVHECAVNVGNHGRFVSCVAHLTNGLKKAGVITGQEKGAIQSCAAQANLP
ncbi:MAG: hypothetical protein HYZ50_14765 [Deltaproteobacteria bacterium]|nr:hypothetical protein [Deltaproteobacteria bacterium]